jgi:radical SAM protein (TIGR01212 family)
MERIYPWGHGRRYNDYPTFIKNKFGGRVQKISINVGFTCPNRDGTKGRGGCIYCDNNTFKPGYCEPDKSISKQVQRGIDFFESKYANIQFMAYFQSYTNTYAPVDDLKQMYYEALQHPKVIGLIIGTRPDCINREIIKMLQEINQHTPVAIEFGLESTKDETLQRINRCHTWQESMDAIELCSAHGIETGGHLILGLPGETDETLLSHAKIISELPLKTIKLHQLQIIKNTPLAKQYAENPDIVKLFTFESYLDVVIRFLELLNPAIILERFVSTSPLEKLIAPNWNSLKNFEIVAKIEKELKQRDTWQGRLYKPK